MAWQLGDYCSAADFKRDIRTSSSDDDDIIEDIIRQSSREIDLFCNRHFYGVVETRRFDALYSVDGLSLLLDEDLSGVVSITVGDGTTVDDGEYVLMPINASPKTAIKILATSGKWWSFITDPEAAIAIAGTWGFVAGTTPPEPIKRAALMLARYRYEQFQAPFETQGQGDIAAMNVPSAIPESIKNILMSYRKPYVRAVERM